VIDTLIADRLRERLWDLLNIASSRMVSPPFPRADSMAPAKTKQIDTSSVNAVYGWSSYREEKKEGGLAQSDRMLKYWDKHIIPPIQNYVRGSFKDYEMVYHKPTSPYQSSNSLDHYSRMWHVLSMNMLN
jgi:hypothetical protein